MHEPFDAAAPAAGGSAPVPAPPFHKPTQKLYEVRRAELLLAAVSLPLMFFAVLSFWAGFRFGFTAAYLLVFAVLTAYLCRGAKRPGAFSLISGILGPALGCVYLCSDNGAVLFLAVPLLAALTSAFMAGLAGRKMPDGDLGPAAFAAEPFAEAVAAAPRSVRSVFSAKGKRGARVGKAALGVLAALPVFIAVMALLKRSDAAFEGLIGKIISEPALRAAQLVLALLLTPLLLGYAFSLKQDDRPERLKKEGKGIETLTLVSGMALLCAAYLLYLFSQLAYFFSGFMGILPPDAGFSTAEYARRGFFELCVIAAINFAVLFFVLLFSRKKEGKLPVALRVPAVFIVCFSLLLICVAISKLLLYIRTYGLTTLRLGTASFAIFLAVVFLALGLRLFIPRVKVLSVALPAAACVLLALGFADMNRAAATYNYNRYVENGVGELDIEYFGSLGGSGMEVLVRLADDGNAEVREEARRTLWYALSDYYIVDVEWSGDKAVKAALGEKRETGLLSYCVPRARAYRAIGDFLDSHPSYLLDMAKKEDFPVWAEDW